MDSHASKTLVVIGAGAAGFFCAVTAARLNPQLKVIILEKTGKLLSKVRISGGGRCNVTHACFEIDEMSRRYPRGNHFVKKCFHQFFTSDTIRWFEERGVTLKTEPDGRMFPATNSSQTIIDCLLREANRYDVSIRMNTEVKQLHSEAGKFVLQFTDGASLNADFVCVACGGYPKTGMFDWLRQLGHSIEDPVPSLFTFNMPGHPITKLMGISIGKVRVRIIGSKLEEEGPMLITHWGFSGPAVLRLSAWGARELKEKEYCFRIIVNWIPIYNEQTVKEFLQNLRASSPAQKVWTKNQIGIPQRLWEFFLEHSGISKELRWADLPSRQQNLLAKQLCAAEFDIKGKTTFKEEFVTAGGVRLAEIDHNTMMSKKMDNLFFAGEILDVDGITGGFNFQHAWTSGFIGGKTIASL